MKSGIYKITSPKNRVYIGQSVDISNRLNNYKIYKKYNSQTRLKNSFNKYGIENHTFEVIEYCEIESLNERERYWQEHYDVLNVKGLNCKYTTTLDKSGVLSEESKLKISESLLGSKRTLEQRQNMSKSQKGKKQSVVTINKRVAKLKEYLKEESYRKQFGKAFKKEVYQYDKNWNFISQYESVTKASKILGVNRSSICKAIKGTTNKTCKGFYWTYTKKLEKLV